jgi:hypothetical protein
MSRKIKVWPGNWTVTDVRKRPTWLFIFGDNDEERGHGGQAIIRDLENAAGVPTKRSPHWHNSAYYTDEDYDAQCERIRKAFDIIVERAAGYERVVFPSGGLGTGLADLEKRAPRTMEFLIGQIGRLRSL